MTEIVTDASVVAGFLLPDEDAPVAARTLAHLAKGKAIVPSVFWHEVRNVLIMAERRRRIAAADVAALLASLRSLPIADAGAGDDHQVLRLAAKHSLSAYDAVYVALALAKSLPLATLDEKVARAASAEKVPLFR